MRLLGCLALIPALAACDAMLVDPAPAAEAEVSFAVVAPAGAPAFGDLSNVVAQVENVRLTIIANGESREVWASTRLDRGALKVRTRLGLEEATGWVEIRADLYYDEFRPLFRGQALFNASDIATDIRFEIIPVASRIVLSGGGTTSTYGFDALGDTLVLTASARFVTNDVIEGAVIQWTSTDPAVEIVLGDRAVSRRNGGSAVVAAALGAEASRLVIVRQAATTLVGLAPSDTTVSLGQSFHARPLGTDPNGFALLPGAGVTYTANGSVTVSNGIVTASSLGTGYAQTGPWRINVTVVP
jgi:hypothetical protein